MAHHMSDMSAVVLQLLLTLGPHSAGLATPHSHMLKRIGRALGAAAFSALDIAVYRGMGKSAIPAGTLQLSYLEGAVSHSGVCSDES